MTKYILLGLFLFPMLVQAQLLTDERTFTRQDTLRGTLGPERSWFDVQYYDLNILVDPEEKFISGYNEITFLVKEKSKILQFDLFENMNVIHVLYEGEGLEYEREGNATFVQMPKGLKVGKEYKISIYYSGNPIAAKRAPWDGGFDWKKDNDGNHWIGVACEGIGASLWWPNKDHLSDEPDRGMRISCAVPDGLKFVGNGNFSLEEPDAQEGYTRYHWLVSYPINNYNVTLNIGNYVHFNDTYTSEEHGDLSLDYYVMPYNLDKAKVHFEQVKPMLGCFEEAIGPYPFWDDGFALVETPYLGMEHQGAIAYGNDYKTGYAGNTRYTGGLDFDYIIIHEAGHEWYGNSVSAYDMADLWIHEGFCTYSEGMYVECLHGYEKALEYVNKGKAHIGNEKSIAGTYNVNDEGDGDMYAKGALFLNTLRHVIDDEETWKEAMYDFTQVYRLQQINADTVLNYFNRRSGKNLDKIFEQYVFHPALPVFQYKTSKKGKNTIFEYKWSADVKGFDMPMKYRLSDDEDWTKIQPTGEWQTIKLSKTKPEQIQFAEQLYYVEFEEN